MSMINRPPLGSTCSGCRQGMNKQRGVATLVVVMVLLFLMALVAAYTSRNLIFEQRTSVNQYRSTQAFEAAEAGVEWALAMLNGGRVGSSCTEATATGTSTSFRQRYIRLDPATGMVQPVATVGLPGCVWTNGAWACECPDGTASTLTPPTTGGIAPAFRVRFTVNGLARPGVVRIESNGCTRLDNQCLNFPAGVSEREGSAQITALVALKNALTTPPAAAITVLGNVAGGGVLKAYNTSTSGGGVTIHAGGNIVTANFDLYSVPGSNGSDSVFPLDTTISDLAADPPRFFASVLGAWPDTYRLQPAAIRFECPNSGCRQALADKIAANPGRVIWIPGDLTLDTAGDVGSLPDPAVLTEAGPAVIVATGRVRFLAAARIYGLVYTQSGNWEGSGEILGAAVVQDNLAAAAAPTVVMTPAVLDALRLEQGSFVLLPGGWKDFAW